MHISFLSDSTKHGGYSSSMVVNIREIEHDSHSNSFHVIKIAIEKNTSTAESEIIHNDK